MPKGIGYKGRGSKNMGPRDTRKSVSKSNVSFKPTGAGSSDSNKIGPGKIPVKGKV